MTELPTTIPVICRECEKEFPAKVTYYFLKSGKAMKRHGYWCSPECYAKHLKEINRR